MRFTDILYEKRDGVAWITINRPEVYNALRGRTTDDMATALEDAAVDDLVRAVVIAGAGLTLSARGGTRVKTAPLPNTVAQANRASST